MHKLIISFFYTIILSSAFASDISEQRGIELIDKVMNSYEGDKNVEELLAKHKRKIDPYLMYEEENVFGQDGIWGRADTAGMIMLAGGALKSYFSSDESFVALICHEIGHVIGGLPATNYHLSYEGQADYYAASVCMKRFFLKNKDELERKDYIHDHYFKICEKKYTSEVDIRICAKTMQAGLNLALSSAFAIGEILLPSPGIDEVYETPYTLEDRDSAQCIVDTFEAGALCDLDPYRKIDFTKETVSGCDNRPKCWYKSSNE